MESIVRRFVENKVSPEELTLLEAYFKTQEGLRCLERIIDEHESDFNHPHLILSGVHNTVADPPRPAIRFRSWASLAAAVVGVMIMAFAYFYMTQTFSTIAYKTAPGEKTTVTLPDGTIVTMNGNSSLSYNERDWDGDTRPLQFSGEGYFKVKSNPAKPFIVNTSAIAIKVLGTTFNVKSYDEDPAIETTLVEGKVQLQRNRGDNSGTEVFELSPDQKATYSKDSGKIVMQEAHLAKEIAWVNGSLVFEDEPFSEIIKDLERWYGVNITAEDRSSLNCRFNAIVENESLEQVMQLFTVIGNVEYQFIDDHSLVIKGSICKPETKTN